MSQNTTSGLTSDSSAKFSGIKKVISSVLNGAIVICGFMAMLVRGHEDGIVFFPAIVIIIAIAAIISFVVYQIVKYARKQELKKLTSIDESAASSPISRLSNNRLFKFFMIGSTMHFVDFVFDDITLIEMLIMCFFAFPLLFIIFREYFSTRSIAPVDEKEFMYQNKLLYFYPAFLITSFVITSSSVWPFVGQLMVATTLVAILIVGISLVYSIVVRLLTDSISFTILKIIRAKVSLKNMKKIGILYFYSTLSVAFIISFLIVSHFIGEVEIQKSINEVFFFPVSKTISFSSNITESSSQIKMDAFNSDIFYWTYVVTMLGAVIQIFCATIIQIMVNKFTSIESRLQKSHSGKIMLNINEVICSVSIKDMAIFISIIVCATLAITSVTNIDTLMQIANLTEDIAMLDFVMLFIIEAFFTILLTLTGKYIFEAIAFMLRKMKARD